MGAEERRAALEYEIFNKIRAEVVKNNKDIQKVAQFLAKLDCLLTLAEVAEQNNYELSSSQKRLWVLNQLDGGNIAYNEQSIVKMHGYLDRDAFHKAIDSLITRHESLRTNFIIVNEDVKQKISVPKLRHFKINEIAFWSGLLLSIKFNKNSELVVFPPPNC